MNNEHILEIGDLRITFESKGRKTIAVDGISFALNKNETLGIVGESGSGKSVSSLAIMGLIQSPPGKVDSKHMVFQNSEIGNLPEKEKRKFRGADIAMIFQEPMTSLNPSQYCGKQVEEMLILHTDLNPKERKNRVLELFSQVKLPDPDRAYDSYPHELSGGQLQRVMIAMAISCNPKILIADEPTTALDVTVQKEILELLNVLKEEYGNSIIFITHDLGVVKQITDRIIVMQKGAIVEEGKTLDVFNHPKHPYTRGLLGSKPPMDLRYKRLPTVSDFLDLEKDKIPSFLDGLKESDRDYKSRLKELETQEIILKAENLKKYYPTDLNFWGKPNKIVKAVDDVSFDLKKGEILGLVGESGSGKSTLAKILMRLIPATSGKVYFEGQDLFSLRDENMRKLRKDYQIIFQDPYSSLNPRMTVGEAILEPLRVHNLYDNRKNREAKVIELLEKVGIEADHFHRYPHQFSGGQRQRICIARSVGLDPKFILCDESVSALDVSVQAQVLNLLKDLKDEYNLSYIFITHDLSVVKFISDRIMVMNQGKIVERGNTENIISDPQNVYTQQLIEAIL